MYGGVGLHSRHGEAEGFGCDCSNARFDLDYFGRSFVPEVDHYSVAVLDRNGNLILRIGGYGNFDDGQPPDNAPRGSPSGSQRPAPADGVALFHAPYVAVHTDRRVFIADPGNHRVAAVRLDYHASEGVALH